MRETKTKITAVWAGLCGMWAFALILAFTAPAAQGGQKEAALISAQPEVLGAFTDKPRGTLSATVPVPKVEKPVSLETINAKSFLVYDQKSGAILLAREPDKKLPIASLTKLVTALIAYERLDLNGYFPIPAGVGVRDEPVIAVPVGEEVKGFDMFNAMLVASENDAAKIFSLWTEQATGENFVGLMNQKAKDLGMQDTEFSNPIGFYSNHNYSTANDLKKLVDETQKYSAFLALGKKTDYVFETKSGQEFHVLATNKLIKNHPDLYAIKTGYTKESLGTMATRADVRGHSVIIIVLGSEDREGDTLKLKQLVENNVSW